MSEKLTAREIAERARAPRLRPLRAEFLRPGPPHNQLLSRLVRYLAICGEAEVGEVSVPYEHVEFLRRIRDLRYRRVSRPEERTEAAGDRQDAIHGLGREMSRFLAGVPGLPGRLGSVCQEDELIHLEIVVSAAELAMLPFELAGNLQSDAPGDHLLLSSRPQVCLTRRIRGLRESTVSWPRRPRVLFVAASPTRSVPFEAHLEALLRALRPWLPPARSLYPEAERHQAAQREYHQALGVHLKVLEKATIADITEACAQGDYTHIHVLAHGVPDPDSAGRHYGLALHAVDDPQQAHVVSGSQFATAIRRDGTEGRPTVVTLAVCDSGTVNDVLYTGASFAHDVHRAGVPFVVASQFPLSEKGSVDVCEHLYRGLLLGKDPRPVLCDLRTHLHSVYGGATHDWASLLAYAVLPPDLTAQLEEVAYIQARRALNAAFAFLDREIGGVHKSGEGAREHIELLRRLVEDAVQLLPDAGRFRVEALGLKAASRKRIAHVLFRAALAEDEGTAPRASLLKESRDALQVARDTYGRAFSDAVSYKAKGIRPQPDLPLHWCATQQLALTLVLGAEIPPHLLSTAFFLASNDRYAEERAPDAAMWAQGTLLELHLLAWWMDGQSRSDPMREAARELRLAAGQDRAAIESTFRQLERYLEWWWTPALARDQNKPPDDHLVEATRRIVAELKSHWQSLPPAVDRTR